MATATIHSSAVIDNGAVIGEDTFIWHFSHIMPGAKIGEGCIIGQNCFIDNGAVINNRVKIQNNVSVYKAVHIEDDVFIGPSVVFTNVVNPRSFINRKHAFKMTTLKKGCTIGANATIVCGNTIGEFAMVGAGSVVTKNVAPYELVAGNPGTHCGWISKAGEKLVFDTGGKAVCPESNDVYSLTPSGVVCF